MTENAPRILIIDDDENIRKTLEILLTNEGYLVDFATNGKEAIEKTNSTIYNVLIESKTREASGESSTTEDTHAESLSTLQKAKNFVCANTGFPALDEVIGGGIPKPSCVCVSGESLSYMNTFVFQLIHNFLENGLKGLYVCLDRPASETKQYFDEIGLNIDRYSEDYSIFFLDFFLKAKKR